MISRPTRISFALIGFFLLSSFTTLPSSKVSFGLNVGRLLNDRFSVEKEHKNLLEMHDGKVFGIDISHYQGIINWDEVGHIKDSLKISFVMTRATYGSHRKDVRFDSNWQSISEKSMVKGAYHYYRPDENSIEQAKNFVRHVSLQDGDLPPILDIEARPRRQSVSSLRSGLKKWLDYVEKHYGVKPIIYTNDGYYKSYLYGADFKEYPLWIANYNDVTQPNTEHWKFWQFSQSGKANGIKTNVDLNVFNGNIYDLYNTLINKNPTDTPKQQLVTGLTPGGVILETMVPETTSQSPGRQ